MLELLGAGKKDRFISCSDHAEALNQVLFSAWFDGVRETGKNHILVVETEEEKLLERLETLGCRVKVLPLNEYGQLTKEVLEEHIGPRSSLLSIPWVNPLTGVIQPIEELAKVCKEKGVLLHVDGEGVIGHLYFRLQDYPIDFFSFSLGVIVKEKTSCTPLILGNRNLQTNDREIVARIDRFEHTCTEIARLRDLFEKLLGEQGAIYFQKAERLTNISVFSFPGVPAETLASELKKKGMICKAVDAEKVSYSLQSTATEEQIERDVAYIFKAADFSTRVCVPGAHAQEEPAFPDLGPATVYPGFETMSDGQKFGLIEKIIEKEIRPYIELDAGGIELIEVQGFELTIAYSGACTTCYSATGSTLSAIQQILRMKVHPELLVIPRF